MTNLSIPQLIEILNHASEAYEQGNPIMSDTEWDKYYFELLEKEKETGQNFPDSPTQMVFFKTVSELKKVKHNHLMLSLNKTKDVTELRKFLGTQEYVVMPKYDGLTCSLMYENGHLVGAETRGNGEEGEDILHNALVIHDIPNTISFLGKIIIDGEIFCDIDTFNKMNKDNDYANPRAYAAGSIRLLDSEKCYERKLSFAPWDIIENSEIKFNTLKEKLYFLQNLGFDNIWYFVIDSLERDINLVDQINDIKDIIPVEFPIDGLVFKYNNIEYYEAQGKTTHHFKGGLAFKFEDEKYETQLLRIEFEPSRFGSLTPVAVFNPINIDGTTITRASLHNLSVMEEILGSPYLGQTIYVEKKNMIIPQIVGAEHNLLSILRSKENYNDSLVKSIICPVCGSDTKIIISDTGVKLLKCSNNNCQGQKINLLDHFCSKKGLNIKGLSKKTLGKLIDMGYINNIIDIFKLYEYKKELYSKEGFGEDSINKLIEAIEYVKTNTTLTNFITALSIPLVGTNISKILENEFKNYPSFRAAVNDESYHFDFLEGIGEVINNNLKSYDYTIADELMNFITLKQEIMENHLNLLNGLSFVITGKLKTYKNRDELISMIESAGGKVVGTISKNVNYLINNDINSISSKNVKAKALNIPIISEEEFKQMLINN